MTTDVVFPNKNETEFLKVAEKLGYTTLIFIYEKKDAIPAIPKSNIEVVIACTEKTKKADLIIKTHSEQDRQQIEQKAVHAIYDIETEKRKDFLHQRASGMNHIIAKLCKEKKVIPLILHNTIMREKRRGQLMGRIMQNISLYRKYKVPFALASGAKKPVEMRSPHDLQALGIVLGMHPSEAKAALCVLGKQ